MQISSHLLNQVTSTFTHLLIGYLTRPLAIRNTFIFYCCLTMAQVATNLRHKRLLILFGSQTGKAQSFAIDIFKHCRSALQNVVEANEWPFSIHCFSMDLSGIKFTIENETLCIIVVATVGEGEPPCNTEKFWRKLCKKYYKLKEFLKPLRYSIFALGDSNYERFAVFGRQLDAKLRELGARQFYNTGFGDDYYGSEIGFEAWLQGLIPALRRELSSDHQATIKINYNDNILTSPISNKQHQSMNSDRMIVEPSALLEAIKELSLPQGYKHGKLTVKLINEAINPGLDKFYFSKFPLMNSELFTAELVDIVSLTRSPPDESFNDKVVLEAVFRGDQEMIDYDPGDAFGFICGNSDHEVNLVIHLLGLDGEEEKTVKIDSQVPGYSYLPRKINLRNLIKYYLEIRGIPKKSCLRMFADYCSDPCQRRRLWELSSREGSEEYRQFIVNPKTSFLDILVMFDSCRPPLEIFIYNLPCFVPRYYTLINTPTDDRIFKIAFNVIPLKNIHNREESQLFGVFTGLIYRLWKQGTDNFTEDFSITRVDDLPTFHLFKKKNDHFKPPPLLEDSMIMVAAGTGVTPFLSFLEHRDNQLKCSGDRNVGETWLLYGCRDSGKDFIYRDKLIYYQQKGILHHFHSCFSREVQDQPNDIRHVQDLIHHHRDGLYKLVRRKNATIYVCGDLERLSSSVFNGFIQSFSLAGEQDNENVSLMLQQLRAKGKYLQDIWL